MFDYEEKWYITILKELGTLLLGIAFFVILGLICMCFPQYKYHYEYVDLDNNKGIARECSYKFEGYKKGGQGSPVCELEDGTIKQVKEYKYIFDGTIRPIKEIIGDDK